MSFSLSFRRRFRSEPQVLKPRLTRLNALIYRDPETVPQCLNVYCESLSSSESLSDSHSDLEDDNISQPRLSESYVEQVTNERENSDENEKTDGDLLKIEFNPKRESNAFQTKSISSKSHFNSVKTDVNSSNAEGFNYSKSEEIGSSEETELNSSETEEVESKETIKTIEISPPFDFLCPLSLDIMVDPVTISSGQTYERAFLKKWLEGGHRTCPTTNIVLEDTKMVPNKILKVMILEWCEKHNFEIPDIETVNQRVEEIVKSGKGGGGGGGRGEGEGRSEGEESMEFHYLGMGMLRRRQVRTNRLKHFRQMMANMKPSQEIVDSKDILERNLGNCKRLEELIDLYEVVEDYEKGKEAGSGGGEECSDLKSCSGCCKNYNKRRGERREEEREEERGVWREEWRAEEETFFFGENEIEEENERKTIVVLRRLTKISSMARETVVDLNAVPFLLEIIPKSKGCVLDAALTAILNLSVENTVKQIIVFNGGIPILAKIVNSENPNKKSAGLAIGTLCQLAVIEENRVLICKTGVICRFLDFLCNEEASLRLQRDTTLTLFNLGIDEFCREEIVNSGGVERIISVLMKNLKSKLREDVLLLLSVISKNKIAQRKLIETGGVLIVMEILKEESILSPLMGHVVAILFQIASGSSQGRLVILDKILLSKIFSMAKGESNRGRAKALALLQVLQEP